ncbi:hypothetical protein RvY_09560 [Ramazzottius varieornatus]|uniref:HTH CENPB-type domain-containing protein n=1 Tax=Ramazzottius varieornatus TaxID=947166 RepID=A0A1D1VIV1_RAMVA|nr:hypothetical protein RvY_09560 [Ramazzottius varieornatus]
MESINLLNVIKLLEWDYKVHYRIDDFPSEADRQFKDIVKDFIDLKITESVTPVYAVEEDLQYDLQMRVKLRGICCPVQLLNGQSEADFDVTEPDRLLEPVSSGTEPSSHELYIPRLPNPKLPVDQLVNLEYKKRAVTYLRNAVKKKRLTLATAQRSFGKVTSIRQLYDWEKQVVEGSSRLDKLKALRLDIGKQFFLAKRKKQVVKDLDLRRWALTANETVNVAGFTASPDWIGKLKRYYGIVDRKITKFVTKKSIQEARHVKESAEACVALVRSRIGEYGLDCLWNADQSGFEYMMRPGRTLETAGVKHMEAITQSENPMTHSYTVMMAVSPGRRKFLPVLFLTLKEEKGVFGRIVSRTMFEADNLYVTASTSGKMTKKSI